MRAAYRLLRQRTVGSADPQRITARLAVIAFATTTALLLIVVGGVGAFVERAEGVPSDDIDKQYPALAATAAILLVIPLVALGGSAARLAVNRRDARLAALRLAGATTPQVTLIALLEAVAQGALGAIIGAAGYLALIPVFAQVRFQGRAFELTELWVGPVILAVTVLGIILLAAASSLLGLARVAITPLGVANRHSPAGPTWVRAALLGIALLAWLVVSRTAGVGITVLLAVLAIAFGAISLAGPFVMWCAGRWTVRRAKDVPTLLACTMQTFGADDAENAEQAGCSPTSRPGRTSHWRLPAYSRPCRPASSNPRGSSISEPRTGCSLSPVRTPRYSTGPARQRYASRCARVCSSRCSAPRSS